MAGSSSPMNSQLAASGHHVSKTWRMRIVGRSEAMIAESTGEAVTPARPPHDARAAPGAGAARHSRTEGVSASRGARGDRRTEALQVVEAVAHGVILEHELRGERRIRVEGHR